MYQGKYWQLRYRKSHIKFANYSFFCTLNSKKYLNWLLVSYASGIFKNANSSGLDFCCNWDILWNTRQINADCFDGSELNCWHILDSTEKTCGFELILCKMQQVIAKIMEKKKKQHGALRNELKTLSREISWENKWWLFHQLPRAGSLCCWNERRHIQAMSESLIPIGQRKPSDVCPKEHTNLLCSPLCMPALPPTYSHSCLVREPQLPWSLPLPHIVTNMLHFAHRLLWWEHSTCTNI